MTEIIVINKILNLDQSCRTCLSSVDELFPIFASGDSEREVKVHQVFDLLQIKVSLNDGLPENVCAKCITEIKRIADFIELCKQTENILKQHRFDKNAHQVKLEEYIDDLSNEINDFEPIQYETESKNEDLRENLVEDKNNICEDVKRKKLPVKRAKVIGRNVKPRRLLRRRSISPDGDQTGSFLCEECPKQFEQKKNLLQHQLTHQEKKYLCSYCGKAYMVKANLIQHVRVHTGERPFKCPDCGKSFARQTNLKQHLLTHTGIKPFECDVCLRRFTQVPHLIMHRRTHTGNKPYKCTMCSRAFTTPAGLRKHTLRHTGEKPHECEQCNRKFSHIDALRRHIKVIHTQDGQPQEVKAKEKCAESVHLCNVCGKQLASATSLTIHQRVHTDERPYGCEICGKRFKHQPTLKVHILTHTGERPYKCSHCDKTFAQRNHLTYHCRTHSGEKPYECSHCHKRFALNGNLTVHMRTHTGETPFLCAQCGKGFYDSSSLRKHARGHHPQQDFIAVVINPS